LPIFRQLEYIYTLTGVKFQQHIALHSLRTVQKKKTGILSNIFINIVLLHLSCLHLKKFFELIVLYVLTFPIYLALKQNEGLLHENLKVQSDKN
jgi:hypothetical protein